MDKTGTITYSRSAGDGVLPAAVSIMTNLPAATAQRWRRPPEGTSIVDLALERGIHEARRRPRRSVHRPDTDEPEWTARTGRRCARVTGSAVRAWLAAEATAPGPDAREELTRIVEDISTKGGAPLVVAIKDARGHGKVLGVVYLKDVVKGGLVERFAQLRSVGIRTVMITDNPLTAKAIADEAGVDDFPGRGDAGGQTGADPPFEQEGGRLVAMTGDGTNDAPGSRRPTSASR